MHVEITESSLDALMHVFREKPGQLYAILDSCDEPRVPEKTRELGAERAVSLYRGSVEQDYADVAPYLVSADESLVQWIEENLWNDPWGIFMFAATDLVSLRKHFRRFLTVEDPDGKRLFFRFYDPRVLKDYLETCDDEECKAFFGPSDSFFAVVDGAVWLIRRQKTANPGIGQSTRR